MCATVVWLGSLCVTWRARDTWLLRPCQCLLGSSWMATINWLWSGLFYLLEGSSLLCHNPFALGASINFRQSASIIHSPVLCFSGLAGKGMTYVVCCNLIAIFQILQCHVFCWEVGSAMVLAQIWCWHKGTHSVVSYCCQLCTLLSKQAIPLTLALFLLVISGMLLFIFNNLSIHYKSLQEVYNVFLLFRQKKYCIILSNKCLLG